MSIGPALPLDCYRKEPQKPLSPAFIAGWLGLRRGWRECGNRAPYHEAPAPSQYSGRRGGSIHPHPSWQLQAGAAVHSHVPIYSTGNWEWGRLSEAPYHRPLPLERLGWVCAAGSPLSPHPLLPLSVPSAADRCMTLSCGSWLQLSGGWDGAGGKTKPQL